MNDALTWTCLKGTHGCVNTAFQDNYIVDFEKKKPYIIKALVTEFVSSD